MQLKIHLFAGLSDLFQAKELRLDAPETPLDVRGLKAILIRRHPHAADVIAQCFIAKNQAYAAEDETVCEADELALIPPVSGGEERRSPSSGRGADPDRFTITREPIDIGATAAKVLHPDCGASLLFIGTTREWTQGKRTVLLDYDAYEPMALRMMRQIDDEIQSRWPGVRLAVTHRIGRVDVGEASVVIASSSPHRAACYEANRYAIDRLKQTVPIWKKEIWEDGSEWKGHQQGPWNPVAPLETNEGR